MSIQIKTDALRHIEHTADLCIVGGGLSGMIAAISAAREGAKVILMQDRPVFGGNASSEIRMWVRGAKGLHNRETGIISELEEENIYRNPTLTYSLWDSVLYGAVKAEENIESILNCSCVDADTDPITGDIVAVKGWQMTTYTWHTVRAKYFADCSGDSILAPIVGAEYRVGREGHNEYGEPIGPEVADRKTMGMSCMIQARETDHPVKFTPPSWAYVFPEDTDFGGQGVNKKFANTKSTLTETEKLAAGESISTVDIKQTTACARTHEMATDKTNFWWIELGGDRDSIHDSEEVRDDLLKVAFGVWDHIKNYGDHHAENWELEWVGFLPGKRESRRYIGDHVLTQHDVEAEGKFEDLIAFGGWPMDDHNPAGLRSHLTDAPPSLLYPAPSPYGIPYRSLYSKNIGNLFFAGRNISATHAANSSTRVMATCALLGQAMGTAAGMCVNYGLTPRQIFTEGKIPELQAKLMDAGCYLPWHTREIPAISREAKLNLTEEQKALLHNGIERPDKDNTVNYVALNVGDEIVYDFGKPTELHELRLMFDPDFSRKSISKHVKMRTFAQRSSIGLDFDGVHIAKTLVKAFEVYMDEKLVFSTDYNYHSLVRLPLEGSASKLTVKFTETRGEETVHVFSCDVK